MDYKDINFFKKDKSENFFKSKIFFHTFPAFNSKVRLLYLEYYWNERSM